MFLVNENGVNKCIKSCDECTHVLDSKDGIARSAPQASECEQWDDNARTEATVQLNSNLTLARMRLASTLAGWL